MLDREMALHVGYLPLFGGRENWEDEMREMDSFCFVYFCFQ